MQKEVDVETTLDRLRNDHRLADQRLKELARHLSLSPEEQLEFARLKKQKLHLKDEIPGAGSAGRHCLS